MDGLEIDRNAASRLARSGSSVYVLAENVGDGKFVKEVLEGSGKVEEVEFNEAKVIVMGLGPNKYVMELAQKYENSIIVCPHGNTSLVLARALNKLGVKAHSLNGGLAGLRSR